jgi:hypothetical protein
MASPRFLPLEFCRDQKHYRRRRLIFKTVPWVANDKAPKNSTAKRGAPATSSPCTATAKTRSNTGTRDGHGFLTQNKIAWDPVDSMPEQFVPSPNLEVRDSMATKWRSGRGFSADVQTSNPMLRKIISPVRDGCRPRRLGFRNQISIWPRVHRARQRCLFEAISIVCRPQRDPLPA